MTLLYSSVQDEVFYIAENHLLNKDCDLKRINIASLAFYCRKPSIKIRIVTERRQIKRRGT